MEGWQIVLCVWLGMGACGVMTFILAVEDFTHRVKNPKRHWFLLALFAAGLIGHIAVSIKDVRGYLTKKYLFLR